MYSKQYDENIAGSPPRSALQKSFLENFTNFFENIRDEDFS